MQRIPKATVQRRLQENNRNSGALWTFKQQLVYKVRVRYVKVTIANFGISFNPWPSLLFFCKSFVHFLTVISLRNASAIWNVSSPVNVFVLWISGYDLIEFTWLSFPVFNWCCKFAEFSKLLFYQYFKILIQECISYQCIANVVQVFIMNEPRILKLHLCCLKSIITIPNNLTN